MDARAVGSPAPGEAFGQRLRWQGVLYAPTPRRSELLGLSPAWPCTPLGVRVHRNHAVEAAISVATPYLQFAGYAPEWQLGDYDDSLSFGDAGASDTPAQAEVVWLDFRRLSERMGPEQIADWLAARLSVLRGRTAAPIVVVDWDGDRGDAARFTSALTPALAALGSAFLADRSSLFAELGDRFFDPAREALTGTRMSAAAALASARLLGSSWLPAVLEPRRKAIVVDLDNTLYDGVLGEDGAGALTLRPGHLTLQRQLRDLRAEGMFLALASRNDLDQVQDLFASRADFILGHEDFDAVAVSWEPKSAGLARIAASLRIDPTAMVFVDDNPGELLEAAAVAPGLGLVHALPDAAVTARTVALYPGVFSFTLTEEDRLRSTDLAANAAREAASARADTDLGAYYRDLAVTLTIGHNRAEQLPRLAEMPAKTNQFNLSLRRSSPADVAAWLADDAWQISSVRLADRLADSGVIAFLAARRDGPRLIVEELCVSCRAMGRRLEDLIVAQMLAGGPLWAGTQCVRFIVADGPRNHPARDWLRHFSAGGEEAGAGPAAGGSAPLAIEVGAARVTRASIHPDVRIEVL